MKKENEDKKQDSKASIADTTHERLCAFLLGELDSQEAASFSNELAGSEELRNEKERIAATIGLLRTTASGTESLSPEIMATLEQAARPLPRITPWYSRTPLRAAAGLAAILTGVLGGRALMKEAPGEMGRYAPVEEVAKLDDASDAGIDETLVRAENSVEPKSLAGEARNKLGEGPAGSALLRIEDGIASFGLATGDPAASVDKFPVTGGRDAGQSKESANTVFLGALVQDGSGADPTAKLNELGYVADRRNEALMVVHADPPKAAAGKDLSTGPEGGRAVTGRTPTAELEIALLEKAPELIAKQKLRVTGTTNPPAAGGRSSSGPSGPASTTSTPASPGSSGPGSPGPAGPVAPNTKTFEGLVWYEGEPERDGLSLDFHYWSGTKLGALSPKELGELSPKELDELCLQQTQRILHGCLRRTGERPSDMFYRFWGDNAFELSQLDNQSTFGVDVDTASYTLARKYLTGGHLPTKAQIRTEEFVNYFKPDVAPPTAGVFAMQTELASSRFGNGPGAPSQRWMLRVGIRGREVAREERTPLTLTFVVDTSGSMKSGRLDLVKHAMRLLVSQFDGGDSIAIVGFNKLARVVLPMTSAQNRATIEEAIYGLSAGGGTNAESGLKLGYDLAANALTPQAHNRVVLLSDGVANIGQTDQDRINADVARQREAGIYLNTIGVGMSNHNDNFLEQLANKGDGICNYVDSAVEARRALVDNFTGAFEPIARDVKIQVEFDKNQVYSYRLLGYENRAIADADFRNDAVDAGEVGAGHQVVALYELELTGYRSEEPMATVRLRWKDPSGTDRDPLEDQATEISQAVGFSTATAWSGASQGYRRSVLVAQFAEILRRSVHARGDSLDELMRETVVLANQMEDSDLTEFLTLLQKSRELILNQAPSYGDLSTCVDEIRRNRILKAQYEELRTKENLAALSELELANKELERKIRDLIRRELEEQVR